MTLTGSTMSTIDSRPFVGLAIAETFSISGTRLAQIAVPWLVLTTTGSATWTGVVGFAEMLPYVLAKALGGPLVDRLGAKRIAVWSDSCSVLIVGLIPFLHRISVLHLAVLVPIAALMGLLRGPSDGAKQALIPAVAEAAGMPLERVTGVAGVIERLGGTVGAAVAGGVVALLGAPQALLLNAATFAVAAVCVRTCIPTRIAAGSAAGAHEPVVPYRAQLAQGWRFLRSDPVLVGITVMVSLTNLLDQAWVAVLVPVWAHDGGHGAGAVGLVLVALSAPAIAGSALAAAAGDRLPRLPVYVLGFLAVGLPRFGVFAFPVPIWIVAVVLALGGFVSGFVNPILSAVIFERIPKPLVGRVSALNTSLCWALMPFGGLLGGVLVTGLGLRTATLVVGVAYFVVTLMPLFRRSFRQFGNRPPAALPRDGHPAEV